MKNNNKKPLSSACILVIGDEVLSGRTEDKNINFIAKRCDNIGVSVNEVRIIPDDKETIKKLNYYFDLNLKQWEKESDFLNNSVIRPYSISLYFCFFTLL